VRKPIILKFLFAKGYFSEVELAIRCNFALSHCS